MAPSRRAACWPMAPMRPSSSSAGGRRPSTSRRTSARATRISSPSASSWRRPASGSTSSTAAAASARIPTAASVGPRPSWRSRRNRRRSSSRASTRRSRDRARSSRSRWAWIAAPAWRARSVEQGELGGSEPSLARPHAEEQAPDRLGPVGERHRLERGGRRAVFSHHRTAATLVDDLEPDVGQPERLGDRFRDCGERALRIDGPFEPRPQDAHRAPWLVARAVHRPVDTPLQDIA